MAKTLRMNGMIIPANSGKLEQYNEETEQWEPFQASELSNLLNLSAVLDLINVVLPDSNTFSGEWFRQVGILNDTKYGIPYEEFVPTYGISYALTGETILTEMYCDAFGGGGSPYRETYSLDNPVILENNIGQIVRLNSNDVSGHWIEIEIANDLIKKELSTVLVGSHNGEVFLGSWREPNSLTLEWTKTLGVKKQHTN